MDSDAAPGPMTLAFDVGGSRLKAGILDPVGAMARGPARLDTPKPAGPDAVLPVLLELATQLGDFDRISIGFPGAVRDGVVLTAPNLGTEAWRGFPLARTLADALHKPARLLNDATVQALGVVSGQGVECVITLGTGMGFALFRHGVFGPQLELGRHTAWKRKNYDEFVGAAALHKIGPKRWNRRVSRAISQIATLTTFETLYIGGGNAKAVALDLPDNIKIVSNRAGITGGVRLWDSKLDPLFA